MKHANKILIALTAAAIVGLASPASAGPRRAPTFKRSHHPNFNYRHAPRRHLTSGAKLVKFRSDQKLANGKRVIHAALSRRPLGSIHRGKIYANLNFGINTIRQHVDLAVADGQVTSAEMLQIRLVSQAVARDMQKSFGNIAPWHALEL